jgi:signal transduction histidine kinase
VSRRIALVFAALISALLVAAVVPLGVSMTANMRASFRFDAQSSAHQVAAAAEEYLADHRSANAMNAELKASGEAGDCVAVYDSTGALVARNPGPCGAATDADARTLADAVLDTREGSLGQDGVWFRSAVPVSADEDAGAVVLARSADPLDDRITAMWGWLILTGLGALAVGMLLAMRLARWVARPLRALGATAAQLGDGDLHARATGSQGPREVRELASAFNQMAERTETLVRSHRAWIADVSHQLRTPLTALRLRLDLLMQDRDEDAAAELAGAQDEIARLTRLVDGLLTVARAEAAVPRREPVRVDAVAAERVAAWEPVARERGVRLTIEDLEQATALLGIGDLEQMLDNILANALEAVEDGGRVRVTLDTARGRILLRVADDGPGMSEQAKDAAFHRFEGSGTPGGHGLGLAIVQRLAHADGGELSLHDSPGGGLTVLLDLPDGHARPNAAHRDR